MVKGYCNINFRGIAECRLDFSGYGRYQARGLPCKGLLFAGAFSTTGDFMFDFSTGAGVPLAHWDTTGGLFNRYYVHTYRRPTLS